MSKMDELIRELCPDGVFFVKMGECCTINKGQTPIQKAVPGEYPLVVTTDERKSSNTYQFDKPSVCIPLVSSRGHGVASLNKVYYQEGKFDLGNILCAVTPRDADVLSAKFLYLYLNLKKDVLIVPLMRGGANVSLSMDSLEHIKVPIPPMPVQLEAVRILDKFTEYIALLTSELTVRKKQYSYYSAKILENPKIKVEMVPISALGQWSGGKTPSMANKNYWDGGTIPWISSKDMKTSVLEDTEDHITEKAIEEAGMTLLPSGITAIVTRSGILKHTFPVAFVPFCTTVNQDIKALVVDESISPKYAFYVIQAYREDIRVKTKKQGGTVDSLDFQKVLDYKIPLPSREIQNRLVEVLENFDAICSNLNIGLPAEIEASIAFQSFF